MERIGRAPQRRIWAGICLLALSLPARAQDPKPGEFYEDKTDLGFKVRMPARWETIPPSPDDGNLILKYDPKSSKSVQLGPNMQLELHAWIVKFDRRKKAVPQDKSERKFVANSKNLADWVKHNVGTGFKSEGEKALEVGKVPAVESILLNGSKGKDKGEDVRLYTMLYKLQPEVDVAVVFIAPGEDKKWSKYVNDFRAMAKSFKTVEVDYVKPVLAEGASMRDRKRAELQDQCTRQGKDWKLYETPNYFIVSSSDDKEFIEELKGRLEAIRAVYEVDYPAAKVAEIKAEAARVSTGAKEEKGEPEAEAPPAAAVDPMEASRCSIVRICKDRDEYMSYGGMENTAGFFSPNARELVLYDDRANRGRNFTWLVMNHEAFHQYIFYFYGNISPHSWYNEGTGDFYSGYVYKNARFTLEKNLERKEAIRKAIQAGTQVPLKELMRWSQKEYYGDNKRGADALQNYAQGWSLIWFLRTGKKNNAKGWDPKWDTLLEDYLRILAATGKPEQAIEQCLTGIDIDALEAAWLDYTK